MSKLNDKINELLENVQKQQKNQEVLELKSKENKNWNTTCRYQMKDGKIVSIHTANEDNIVDVMSDLLMAESYKNKAYQELDIDLICSEYNGYTINEWKSDFKKRLNSISLKKQTAKLAKAAADLNSILTEEQKRELKFAEILKDLK